MDGNGKQQDEGSPNPPKRNSLSISSARSNSSCSSAPPLPLQQPKTSNQLNSPVAVTTQAPTSRRIGTRHKMFICLSITGISLMLTGIGITSYQLRAGLGTVQPSFVNNIQRQQYLQQSVNTQRPIVSARDVYKMERVRQKAAQSSDKKIATCQSKACLWLHSYLRDKISDHINPCDNFYDYVCSSNMTYSKGSDTIDNSYANAAAKSLMRDIQRYFRDYLNQNEEQYHKYPGIFLHQAIRFQAKCQSADKLNPDLSALKNLFNSYNLGDWPYRNTSYIVNLTSIVGFLDRDLKLFPFGTVRLEKPFEDDHSYLIHLYKPTTLYQRHQLNFINESDHNYTQRVAIALSILNPQIDVWDLAQEIVFFENTLISSLPTLEFVDFQKRVKQISELEVATEKWSWSQYLQIIFQDTDQLSSDKSIAIMDFDHLLRVTHIINQTALDTLINYVGYKLIVHLSPLLSSGALPLIRLSFDDYHYGTSDRVQGCLHMVENIWPQGMRFFSRMTLSKNNASLVIKSYDHALRSIEPRIKTAISNRILTANQWMEKQSMAIAIDKVENAHLVYFGSNEDINTIANYYSFNSQQIGSQQLLDTYKTLQSGTNNAYWMSKPPKDDLDARYHLSALKIGYEMQLGRNVVFYPHAEVALISDVTKEIEALLYPLVLPDIIRGIFQTFDSRGANIDQSLAISYWWNNDEKSKFNKIKTCFQDQYYVEIQAFLGDNFDPRIMILENIADNAVIAPLHDVFAKALISEFYDFEKFKFQLGNQEADLNKLFFLIYAAGLCENTSTEFDKRKVKFEKVPNRLRVNIPLQNSIEFAKAFDCPVGSPMNPNRRCTLW